MVDSVPAGGVDVNEEWDSPPSEMMTCVIPELGEREVMEAGCRIVARAKRARRRVVEEPA